MCIRDSAKAAELKAEGGASFKSADWAAAGAKYSEAAGWVDKEYDFIDEEDKKPASDLHATCLLNAAQCALKQADWPEAIVCCTKVLAINGLADASRVKALFRRGSARIKTADFVEARECCSSYQST